MKPTDTPTSGAAIDSFADDPHAWLEDVLGERALAWVRERNAESETLLTARPEYAPIRQQLLEVLNSKDRIPSVTRRGAHFYNLWRDDSHPRGLWRRTTLAEYRQPDPAWETVLDLDTLAAAEGENWVWGGADALDTEPHRCLVSLSRGGADASVVREFDTAAKQFIVDGFTLPEAKSSVTWVDADTLYVGTDFGPGSLTDSGYPRVIKRWTRGTPLASAVTVFEGETQDVSVGVSVDLTPGHERTIFSRSLDFYHQQHFLLDGERLAAFDIPSDASFSFWNHCGDPVDTLLIELRSDWTVGGPTHASGSLLAADAAVYLAGERTFTTLFTPTATRSLAGYSTTRRHVIVNVLDNVASRLELWRHTPGGFESRPIEAPSPGTLGVHSLHDPMRVDDPLAEQFMLGYTDFLTPDSLLLGHTEPDAGRPALEPLKARPALFDAEGLRTEQRFATSVDGTRVPYFIVWPRGATPDGRTPTLLYGYGGFEVSLNPWYSGDFGRAWFERGGALVVANIRGGGEFGPAWHRAAVLEHKQRSYDDFIAVAEDLIAAGVTRPAQLGIMGGSNGGLLVGAVFTQRPELFNAVVCQVPLLDMRRFHTLLAGASWMAEYGNPDVAEDWAHIARYSPYQNVSHGAKYPEVLFTTSTRDDRVHPAHARKMAARMRELGHALLYYENIEGGHGGAADNSQRAHLQAMEFAYLWRQLGAAD
ncbi:MAG: prolyl oligopeptidase family serine peptidase [Pseudomonadota bacterium]|nr:prolyl oligopeptidase family serine peptidase [Pseudomonadota bacterium]